MGKISPLPAGVCCEEVSWEQEEESAWVCRRNKMALDPTLGCGPRGCLCFLHVFWAITRPIPAIFSFHVLILLMLQQFQTLIFREFPGLNPKALCFLSSPSEARVLGEALSPPCQSNLQ